MRLIPSLSPHRFPILSIGLAVVMAALAGCAEQPEDLSGGDSEALASENGLKTINGMKIHNGLASLGNGISLSASLTSPAGLSSTSGLMTTADGRTTVNYLVKCALPAGRTITKADQSGKLYTFAGQVGVAPEWEAGSCGGTCERWVSACMLAMVNTTGDHYPLWLVAQNPAISWGLDPSYPFQEGSFFGDIFTSPPYAYYCGGRDFGISPVPGRIGSAQIAPPYADAYGANGRCLPTCTPADYPHQNEGVKACSGWNEIITVWHQ
jgi:hypothetical protein